MLTSFVETTTGRRKGFVESPVFARNGSLALPTLKYLSASTDYEPSWFSNSAGNVIPYLDQWGNTFYRESVIGPDTSTPAERMIEKGRRYSRRRCVRTVNGGEGVRDESHTFDRNESGASIVAHDVTTTYSLFCERALESGGWEYSWQSHTDTWGATRDGIYGPGSGGITLADGWYAPGEGSRSGCTDESYVPGGVESGTWGSTTVTGDNYRSYTIPESEIFSFSYSVTNLSEDDYDALYQEQIDYLDTLNSVSPDDWGTLSVPIDAAGGTRIDVFPVLSGTAGPGCVYGGWTQSAWGRSHKRYWVYNEKDIRLDYVKVTAPTVFLAGHDGTGDYHLEDAAGMAVIRCQPGVSNPGDVVQSPDWTGTVEPQALTDWVVAMPGFAAVMFGVTPEQAAQYVLDRVPSTVRGVYRVEIV